ncbi:hypothetical protein HZC31_04030 [Candidatus Woesearchaeota archaeon]|nr:hypothetical protein [Candidatus Woesearchaeota archaeon]
MTMIETTTGQRTVHLIRHGEKNPSTAAVDPNQLNEKGRRGALAYGVALRSTPTLEVYCSTDADGRAVDRSHDTGWYIHAGYAGLEYDAANALFRSDSAEKQQFVPGLEQRLEQRVPDRILKEYKAGTLTRAEAMEQCYRMLAANTEGVDPAEHALMLHGAQSYLVAVIYHIVGRSPQEIQPRDASHAIVLVGHDPNIGGLQQHLEPTMQFTELAPLEGITVTRGYLEIIHYSFGKNRDSLGFLSLSLTDCLRYSHDMGDMRRVL